MNQFRWILAIVSTIFLVLLIPVQAFAAPRLQEIKEKHSTEDKLVIVIDPGHGGENLGTTENNHEEKSMTLVTALAMYEELLQYDDIEVYLTRTEDKDMSLKERALFAESVEADFLFSIHYNASENHELYGSEVWVPLYPPYNGYGYQFGNVLLRDFRDTGLLIRGVKTRLGDEDLDYYGIIRESVARDVPAVIIEHCHVDEVHDEGFCDDEEKLKAFGRMDALAAAKYFGLKSSALGLDFADYPLEEASAESSMDITLNTNTSPELCQIEFVDADYMELTLTLSVSAMDSDSPLLYYSYSLDGGETFSGREPWPGNDTLTGSYQRDFILTLDIQPDTCPEVVLRAYNNYDLYAESNHYESPWVFSTPSIEEPAPEESEPDIEPEEEPEEVEVISDSTRTENKDIVIVIVLFTIVVILTMMLIVQIRSVSRRKRRRKRQYQQRNEDGRSRNQHR